MGLFDLFKKKKTDDEIELEEVMRKKASAPSQMIRMNPEDTVSEVIKLLSEDRKMMAIKYVKDNTGMGLAEAKAFVEKIEEDKCRLNRS